MVPSKPAPGRSVGATVRKTGTDHTDMFASAPMKLPKYTSPGRGDDLSADFGLGTRTCRAMGIWFESSRSYVLVLPPKVKRTLYVSPCKTPCVPTAGAGSESQSLG